MILRVLLGRLEVDEADGELNIAQDNWLRP